MEEGRCCACCCVRERRNGTLDSGIIRWVLPCLFSQSDGNVEYEAVVGSGGGSPSRRSPNIQMAEFSLGKFEDSCTFLAGIIRGGA